MAQTLEQFVEEIKADLEVFATEYRKQNAANPEQYPLVLPDENSGLWFEFFSDHVIGS